MKLSAIPQTAIKLETEVQQDGRVELTVPFEAGARVVVFIIEEPGDDFGELLQASESSMNFWDNRYDDEDWNDA